MRDRPQEGEVWRNNSIKCQVRHVVPNGESGTAKTAVVYLSYSTGKLHWRDMDNFCREFTKAALEDQNLRPCITKGRRKLSLGKTQNESEPTL